jgi:hypothetical protein
MTFTDALHQPLQGGTVVKDPCTLHEGIIAYNGGQQVVLHKSLSIGRPAMTDTYAFTNGKCKLIVTRVPQSHAHAQAIVQRAWTEVQSGGTPWTLFDNCEDFVSRAYTGSSGSLGRALAVGFLVVVGLFAVVGVSKA